MQIGLVLWNRVGIGTLTGAVELLKNVSASKIIAAAGAGAKDIVPQPPKGKPEDLLLEIEQQLAKDRQAGRDLAAPGPSASAVG